MLWRTHDEIRSSTAAVLCIPLLLLACSSAQAQDTLGQRARFGVPMSCTALALIRGADYPEVERVHVEGHEPRSFAEADRAGLGLMWRHREQFAEEVAVQAFTELFGRASHRRRAEGGAQPVGAQAHELPGAAAGCRCDEL